ncbi:uncharacterized protein LOC131319240 isoform X1 [Rhododendron vialii]|uniref:uncharacterized protein LOC131319240 isoform X1 n=1 Tax=Rhododendron vialii TaxID=182163 RepID=UPI00265EF21F|nr:uncharacterized protein LOC131319240 isoform X1 [Rhododendron vialii]
MDAVLLRTPILRVPPPRLTHTNSSKSRKQLTWVSFRPKTQTYPNRCYSYCPSPHSSTKLSRRRLLNLLPFASAGGETTEVDEEVAVQEPEIQDNLDGAVAVEDGESEGDSGYAEEPTLAIIALLKSYKEAIASNDESRVSEIEAIIKSIEDEKNEYERKVVVLSEELSSAKERILRISADFDNFQKRTERERLSLLTNAQGEVVEDLLPVLDNFERAKAQIKVETEAEEKINNSYQSIYKQFVEILESLGVVPVETVGKPFDPLLHEAIMRDESTEFEEGVIIEQYRKGFQLGDQLLRPSMVKVSAGPGPTKPEPVEPVEVAESGSEASDEGSKEAESPED